MPLSTQPASAPVPTDASADISDGAPTEIEREQRHLDGLHTLLSARRESAQHDLAVALRQPTGTDAAWLERAAMVDRLQHAVRSHDAAEDALCFGRLDLVPGECWYLGRIGLRSDDPDADPVLIDWRSPAARPFYTATAAAPQGVRRRRHLHARGRRVVRIDDELLDGGTAGHDLALVGEAALLSALGAERTGRMGTAIATLQSEQDRIIRSPHGGVLVVQGGPGTGKTVVALHRAAYLLYTQPNLDRRGVLVVGPNALFLNYIQDVLPGLGESSVLLASVEGLFPGVEANAVEPEAVSALKGNLVMADVVAAAVRSFQAPVTGELTISAGGETVTLDTAAVTRAADRARAARTQHNRARLVFAKLIIAELAAQLVTETDRLQERFEEEVFGDTDTAALDRAIARDLASVSVSDDDAEHERVVSVEVEREQALAHWQQELISDRDVRRAVARLWPKLTPERLVSALFADPSLAGEVLDEHQRALLHRPEGGSWTPSDVPLLDEAAELLGEDQNATSAREERERAAALEYAQGVLDIALGSRAQEDDDLGAAQRITAADLLGASALAQRHDELDLRPLPERAAADRTWAFGHVIVDEAQELSPMAWRLLLRRCPAGSFTVVGDMAQSGQVAGPTTWDDALSPFFGARWQLERLTINYRTPAEIMVAADPVLAQTGAQLEPAHAVRHGGESPVREQVPPSHLVSRLAELAVAQSRSLPDGRVAVLVPERLVEAARTEIRLVAGDLGSGADLENPIVVLPPRSAKGLEFDSVLIGEPQDIVGASARGLNDLYVALTRATTRLHVVHSGPVPDVLAHLVAERT